MGNETSSSTTRKPRAFVASFKPKETAQQGAELLHEQYKRDSANSSKNMMEKLIDNRHVWGDTIHKPSTRLKFSPASYYTDGYIMDLETFYTNDKFGPNWRKSYIQQIGACSFGHDDTDFDIVCDLPVHNMDGTERDSVAGRDGHSQPWTSIEDLKRWCGTHQQHVGNSINGFMKILGVKNEEEVFKCIITSRQFWEQLSDKEYPPTSYSWFEMEKYKRSYLASGRSNPLLFRLEDALKFFAEYFKEKPCWYAHNGNGFDYPIMEKWFRIAEMDWRCQPVANAPNSPTTAMNIMRVKAQNTGKSYCPDMVTWSGKENISKIPWPIKDSAHNIKCYDTMRMFGKSPNSKYIRDEAKLGHKGAYRNTQTIDHKTGLSRPPVHDGDSKWIWADGSKTTTKYGFKLQDILADNGLIGNDPTAHTALADCITLRECLYRVWSTPGVDSLVTMFDDMKVNTTRKPMLKHSTEHSGEDLLAKIKRRMSEKKGITNLAL